MKCNLQLLVTAIMQGQRDKISILLNLGADVNCAFQVENEDCLLYLFKVYF